VSYAIAVKADVVEPDYIDVLPPDIVIELTIPVLPEIVTYVMELVIELADAVRLTVPSWHPDIVLLIFQLAVPESFISDHVNDG
jgi:hypothetical protein